jgi:hypothetical protein
MIDLNLKFNYQIDYVFLISEGYTKKHIDYLSSFFSCKTTSFYVHTERLIFAQASVDIENYTPNPNYSFLS